MNVPKIRFSEFKDEWISNKLEDISKIVMGQSPNSENYTNNSEDTILIQGNADLDNGFIVPRLYTTQVTKECDIDDIIMTVRAPVGDVAITRYKACIGRGVCAIKGSKFIYHYLNYLKSKDYWKKISKGSTIDSVTSIDIKQLIINIPNNNIENNRIIKTMDLIDKKIELQSKKIEALKLYKKGLFDNYFSNIKDYRECKLGDICNITTGKLDANEMAENGEYRFYTCAKEYYFIDNYAFDTEALLISGNGANVGYIHYYKGKFNAYQRTYVLDQFKENIKYIKIYLDKYLSSRISSEKREGNTPYITLSTIEGMIIKIPDKNNMNNIVNSITLFSNKISFEENMLVKLQELKKGLMQNMFV